MDVLISHDTKLDLETLDYNLSDIISFLKSKKYLIDDLTINGNTKYMGFCRNTMRTLARRIDIRFIPKDSLGSAMLYFTGSGDFNKNMRTYALKKGYSLNEYTVIKFNNKNNKKFQMKVDTEQEIFDLLEIPYLEPKDRLGSVVFD